MAYVGNGPPIVTARPARTTDQVAVTVASVGPYAFSTRRPGASHRAIRSAGHASPETRRKRSCGSGGSSVASRVGTQHRALIRWATRKSVRSAPTRAPVAGAGTSVAPTMSGTHTSSTEKSNAMVSPWYTRSSSR